MNNKYIINLATSALISYFDNGCEYTQVIEGKEVFIVPQSPEEIVKDSFLHYGKSVEGAIEAARLILKKKYILPIGLSIHHNIFLIRCHAKGKAGTVWLVSSHIADIIADPTNVKKAIIHTKHRQSLTIDIKSAILQSKRSEASLLHSVLLERKQMIHTRTFVLEKDKGIHFVKDPKQLTYTIFRSE
ncbi:competence protein ComK [Niallia sp. XMNu-256]|uniref:competence protein ComK n=1 Tax=Niallia sp. XMNu-256 TaxID=3082444 RepID=UPI0030D23E05